MKSSRFAVASHVLVVLAEHDETPVPSADIARSADGESVQAQLTLIRRTAQ